MFHHISVKQTSKTKIISICFCALAAFIVLCTSSYAATYYVCGNGTSCGSGWSTGSNSNAGTSKTAPCLTIAGGIGKMSGGDTLIIGNGTYVKDPINGVPSGTSGAWTTVKAENVGGVTVDQSTVTADWEPEPISIGSSDHHIQIDGFRAKASLTRSMNGAVYSAGSYIKLFRIAAYNVVPTGAGVVIAIAHGSDHVLVEECWAWSGGRYKFIAYESTNVIFRRCVARHDYNYDTAGGEGTTQQATFVNYDSTNTHFQNCIGIDSGVHGSGQEIYGGFWDENNSNVSKSGKITSCIVLNFRTNHAGMLDKTSGTRSISNSVIWDSGGGWGAIGGGAPSFPANISINQNTIGLLQYPNNNVYNSYGVGVGTSDTISGTMLTTNSIIYGATAYGVANFMTSNWNALWGNGANYGGSVQTPSAGANNITNLNPLTNCLKYLPRIESASCSLKTAGSGGSRIGAEILYRHGTSGTLYGETGYDTLTSEPLWPFPNEARIKADFASYSGPGPAGARGFATGTSKDGTAQTLTKYIWEYLGNQIPADIYGGTPGATAPTVTSFTIPSATTSLTVPVNSFTASDNAAVTGYMLTESTTAPSAVAGGWAASAPTSYTFASSGSKTLYAWAKNAAGLVSTSMNATVVITITSSDTTVPTITSFTLPSTSTSTTVSVTTYVISDETALNASPYCITTVNNPSGCSWMASKPTTVTGSVGSNTFYAWARDAAGNISTPVSATVSVTQSTGNTYYVRPDGMDTASGANNTTGTSGAWRTLQKAANTVAAGDTVLVADGTYAGFYVETSGTSSKPITFKALGTGANITSRNSRTADGINIESWESWAADYIIIDGFNVSGQTRMGIRAIAGTGIKIQNNKVHNNGSNGIFSGGTPSIQVLNNTAYTNGASLGEHNIYISNADSDNPVIRGNICYSAGGGNGIQLNGDWEQGGDGFIDNALIEDNIVYNNTAKGFSLISVRYATIRNNITYGNHGAGGIHIVSEGDGHYSIGNTVVNNTLDETATACVRINALNTGNDVFNNICIGSTGIAFEGSGNNQSNNLLSTNGSGIFLNYAGHDYQLAAGSTAVDTGSSTYGSTVPPSKDIKGIARPQNSLFDRGAYEYFTTSGSSIAPPTGLQKVLVTP